MSSKGPSDEKLKVMIRELIPKLDLQKTGIKTFIKKLSKECGVDVKPRSAFIKEELSRAINEMESEEEETEDEETEDEESVEEPPRKRKSAAAAKKTKTKKESGGAASGRGKGLSVKKEISEALANFLQKGKEMARTEIVKSLWDYIKEHDLQNPENKREIILDQPMKDVFGCDRFTMFSMNKYIGAHIHPFKEVDLTPKEPKPRKKRKKSKDDDSDGRSKKKRKPKKPGLQPPYKLSEELAAVVGKDILPRPQVVTALWTYIKDNGLQNPEDKREILCDARLKSIMDGNSKVTMFNMNRFITKHLVEKLDKSAYTHTGGDEESDDDEESD